MNDKAFEAIVVKVMLCSIWNFGPNYANKDTRKIKIASRHFSKFFTESEASAISRCEGLSVVQYDR